MVPKHEWDRVHLLAVEIVEAASLEDDVLYESRVQALFVLLDDLERRYGSQSRILATRADYSDGPDRYSLYVEALRMSREEGDTENEAMILESMREIEEDEKKTAQPGATDNPGDAQHVREDH